MFAKQKTGFIPYNLSVKLFLLIFVFCCAAAVVHSAQPAQNSDADSAVVQDANLPEDQTSIISGAIEGEAAPAITLEQVQSQKKRISESPDLNAEVKTKIEDIYNQAITYLNQAKELEKNKQDYSQRRKNAPADLEAIKEQLAKQTTFTAPEVPSDITLAQAEQKLAEGTLALEQAKKESATLENEPKRRAERRMKIPEESNSARQKIDEIKSKLAAVSTEGQSAELIQANKTLLSAQQLALEAQIETNAEELLFYDARRDVLAANRDLAVRKLATAEKLVEFWQQKVNDLRQMQAQAAQEEAIRAKAETKYSNKIIKEIADENVTLAKLQTQLAAKVESTSQYSNTIQEKLTSIQKDFTEVQDRIETAGNKITDIMGVLLLTKRNELPDIRKNKQEVKSRLEEMSQAQLNLIKYDQKWRELSIIDQYVSKLVIEPPVSDSERKIIDADAVVYLQNRRKTLESLTDLYSRYITDLAALDAKENSYIEIVQKYRDFIDKNILWVKTTTRLSVKDFPGAIASFEWFFKPQNWSQVINILWLDSKKVPFAYIAIILVFILAFILHRKMHSSIVGLSQKVLDINTDNFLHTFKVFILTILLAANWPIIILFILWRLSFDTSGSDFIQPLSGGLKDLALGIFIFEFLRHMTMPSGLMQDHFRVRPEVLTFIRKHIRWFFSLVIPLTFVFRVLQIEQQINDLFNNTIGQLIFIVILVLAAVFLLKLLRPKGPLVEPYIKRNRDGWVDRLKYFWYPMCLILPLIFSVLVFLGYFYAAWHLYEKLMYTVVLIFLIFIFRAMLTRWLIVIRKRLSIIEREKRQAAQQEISETKDQTGTDDSGVSQQSQSKPEKTIFEISQQTHRLINAVVFILIAIGLWYVWQDVLPALGALGDIELWHTTTTQGTELKIISLGSLVKALIVAVMTVIVARNVPGLLEIVVLRKLPIDAGVRFAITTVCRYIIVIVGVVLAFTEIGIGWSKVQWLVAAMTVGLGFGLQEIFANFISGLIILFEQPVRVDDVVTVSDVTGTVTKIKIRATTIRKWDQRELVVPNREFITGHLINWTLSDKILRRDFIVGIAYGSDIGKAEKILYEVASSNPLVMDNPGPVVLFKGFGDNSLEFELRVYITGIENYVPVWHGINCKIDEEFRKAGIEIAFPQRDIHIRSVKTDLPKDIEKMT